jgi:signal transduction histidine kinase
MRRSWISILAISGFVVLLAVLGGLQYRWLTQVSEAELEKQQKRLGSDTERFAADFNREMQGAYFNFQVPANLWKERDWSEFAKRYDFWRSKTAYPTLIKSITFVENKPDAQPLVYNPEAKAFQAAAASPEFETVRARLKSDEGFQPVFDDVPALVSPIHDTGEPMRQHTIMIRERVAGTAPSVPMPPKYGYLVVVLDAETMKTRLLPELAARYFPDGDFALSVADKAGNSIYSKLNGTTSADASAKLLDLSPDNFMFFTDSEMVPRIGEKRADVLVSQRVQSETVTSNLRGDGKGGVMKIEINRGGVPKTTVLERSNADAGFWTLQVQHRDGSLAAFVESARRRSLAVSFGMLGLLGIGGVLVFVSAQRARTLAQRQIDFVSSVSHEFRTPLAVIYSAGENLADGVAKQSDQVARYGTMIKGEGKKLSGMVEQILEFAGASSGRRKYNFRSTNAAEVAGDALEECMPMLSEKEFKVDTDISPDLPVTADREALSGAIQNLLQNSAKYCNGTKWLRLSASRSDGKVLISVEDKGIGIPRSDMRQIFEPFYRSKQVVDSQIHGSGLGLSLVKQIAEAHGGRVYAESEVGKGSKFTIELAAS